MVEQAQQPVVRLQLADRPSLEHDLAHEVDLYRTEPWSAMALTTFEMLGYSPDR